MAAKDYEYDGGMKLPANKITSEERSFDPSVSVANIPLHGPFFGSSFTLEGWDGTKWIELLPNKDFFFSPSFLSASAATGQEIFSYFVVTKEGLSKVKYDYHVLGQYEDTTLLATIAQMEFNRTDPVEWFKIKGNAESFHPTVRDPQVAGRSQLEVMLIGLEKIRLALDNPNTSRGVTAQEITDIYTLLGNVVTKDDLKLSHRIPTRRQNVEADADKEIYRYSNDHRFLKGSVAFIAADDVIESFEFSVIAHGADVYFCRYAIMNTQGREKPITEFTAQQFGTDYRLILKSSVPGDAVVKIYSQFA